MKHLVIGVNIIFMMLIPTGSISAQATLEDRASEPVVIRGLDLSALNGGPVEELFLYAYDAVEDAWRVMPFQIDEIALVPDLFRLPDTVLRYTYFAPDDGLLDSNDELVFLIGDCGDYAGGRWLADSLSGLYPRIEIAVYSLADDTEKRYAYLYRCPGGQYAVPHPYTFSSDIQNHTVSTDRYALRFDPGSGVLRDIVIKEPGGTGVDIFDTQKLRFSGLIDLGAGFPIIIGRSVIPCANERDNLYLYAPGDGDRYYHRCTAEPVVRLIREVRQTIRFGSTRMDNLAFYVQSLFYPWSSTVKGGARLDPDELKEMYRTDDDIYIELDLLRQSWDFNAAASGMRFYNTRNDGVLIDGSPDVVDAGMEMPIAEWTFLSGGQGSVFTWASFADTAWQQATLYFHDSENGDQGDGTRVRGGDTGDTLSFGDQGILLRNLAQRSANLELGFTAYFLEADLNRDTALKMADQVKHPVARVCTAQSGSADAGEEGREEYPERLQLHTNYPNPFNGGTMFLCYIPRRCTVTAGIYNLRGRPVKRLYSGTAGPGDLPIFWDGRDDQGNPAGSGVYICRLEGGGDVLTRSCLLIR